MAWESEWKGIPDGWVTAALVGEVDTWRFWCGDVREADMDPDCPEPEFDSFAVAIVAVLVMCGNGSIIWARYGEEVDATPMMETATASSVIPQSRLNTGEEGCVPVSDAVVGET